MNEWYEAEAAAERAQQHADSHRWEQALAELDRAIAIQPEHAEWHAARGEILERLSRTDEAITSFEQAIALDPTNATTFVLLALANSQINRHAIALQHLEQATTLDRDLASVWAYQVMVRRELGQLDEAEEAFYRAVQIEDREPTALFWMGQVCADRRQWKRAINCWQQVLRDDPSFPDVRLKLAEAHHALGQYSTARDYYLSELRSEPANLDLLLALADTYLLMDHPREAWETYRQVVELDPLQGRGHFGMGQVALQRADAIEALQCFSRAARLDDELPALHLHWAEALLLAGQPRAARKKLREYRRREESPSRDAHATLITARALLQLNQPKRAIVFLDRLLTEQRRHPIGLLLRGLASMLQQQPAAAVPYFRRAIRRDPNLVVAHELLSRSYLQLGRLRRARKAIDAGLRVAPSHKPLRQLSKMMAWSLVRAQLFRLGQRMGIVKPATPPVG